MTIEAKNLLKIYGRRKVVNDVSIKVDRGEVVGLLGPNGAGKTTSFYMVVGLIKPNKGDIFLDNKNISKAPMYKRARLGLGYLPQEASVFRKLTVEDNIISIWQLSGLPILSLKEKINLVIRKVERAWWKREKYATYYENIFNNKPISESQKKELEVFGELKIPVDLTEKKSFFEKLFGGNKKPIDESNKIYWISKILENLEVDFLAEKDKVLNFIVEYNKFYKLGKKKILDAFLETIWKIKRDEIFDNLKVSFDSTEKTKFLLKIPELLDFENDFILEHIKETSKDIDFENINTFTEYINNIEFIYWNERKKFLAEKDDELRKLNLLKKTKLEEEVKKFLDDNNMKSKEVKDCMAIINWTKKQSEQFQLDDLLDEFKISHIRHSKGLDLSGGERRRVEIARAVATKPSFLLLDEPFAGIDPIAVAGIKDMIVLLKNRNIGVLITDHNVRETLKIIDRGYILSDGKVIEAGTKEQLANSEIARKHYLGEDFSL